MARAFIPHTITEDSALGGSFLENSLRFDQSSNAYLSRTFTGSSYDKQKRWTWSAWVKFGTNFNGCLFSGSPNCGGSRTGLYLDNGRLTTDVCGVGAYDQSDGRYRDATAWYHIVWRFDTTNATAADRSRVYVNGTEAPMTHPRTWSQNVGYGIGKNELHTMGTFSNSTSSYKFDGYMAEINFISDLSLDASHFGYTDFQTGIWRPKKYTGSYTTTSFHLEFKDNSAATATTLGKDTSGRGCNWTPNNFGTHDMMTDTPTNNFPMMFSDISSPSLPATITEAGLKVAGPSNHSDRYERTIGGMPNSGKYYVEVKCVSVGARGTIGMYDAHENGGSTDGGTSNWFAFGNHNGGYSTSWTRPNYSQFGTFQTGEYMTIALDMDNGKIWLNRNAAIDTTAAPRITDVNSSNPDRHYTWFYRETGSPQSTSEFNFGQRPYNFTPPDGFKPLSTNNFPTQQTPHVINPKKYFDTLTYTGNSGTDHDITGLQFQPDLVWIKSRSQGSSQHGIVDSVRLDSGSRPMLYPNLTNAETVAGNYMDVGGGSRPFLHNGIRVNNNTSGNNNGSTYVAWCWKAGGETSSSNPFAIDGKPYATAAAAGLDGGTANPTGASVNTKAGFSIVSYTATNNQNVSYSHGLNQAPEIIIAKDRDNSRNWGVYYTVAGTNTNWIKLNSTDAQGSNGSGTTPVGGSSGLFMYLHQDYFAPSYNAFANGGNDGNDKMVAYMWHSVPGYSKIGVYEGNQSSNGPYIHLGFRPAFIMIKNIDNGSNRQWCMIDATRTTFNKSASAEVLFANDNQTESVANNNYGQFASKPAVDILSNGFKVREGETAAYTQLNRSNTHIYMAFAEQPGSTAYDTEANAR